MGCLGVIPLEFVALRILFGIWMSIGIILFCFKNVYGNGMIMDAYIVLFLGMFMVFVILQDITTRNINIYKTVLPTIISITSVYPNRSFFIFLLIIIVYSFFMMYNYTINYQRMNYDYYYDVVLLFTVIILQTLVRNNFEKIGKILFVSNYKFNNVNKNLKEGSKLTLKLLLNILPSKLMNDFKNLQPSETFIRFFKRIAVSNIDIVDFSSFASTNFSSSKEMICLLNEYYSKFDEITSLYDNMDKIKSIGNRYVFVEFNKSSPKYSIFALFEMIKEFEDINMKYFDNKNKLNLRIGMDYRDAFISIFGETHFQVNLFGSAKVNSRTLGTNSKFNMINVSKEVKNSVGDDTFLFEKNSSHSYYVLGHSTIDDDDMNLSIKENSVCSISSATDENNYVISTSRFSTLLKISSFFQYNRFISTVYSHINVLTLLGILFYVLAFMYFILNFVLKGNSIFWKVHYLVFIGIGITSFGFLIIYLLGGIIFSYGFVASHFLLLLSDIFIFCTFMNEKLVLLNCLEKIVILFPLLHLLLPEILLWIRFLNIILIFPSYIIICYIRFPEFDYSFVINFVILVFFISSSFIYGTLKLFDFYEEEKLTKMKMKELKKEFYVNKKLLKSILPSFITKRLTDNMITPIEKHFNIKKGCIMFVKLNNIPRITSRNGKEVINIISTIFNNFDKILGDYELVKIKSIDVTYVTVNGLYDEDNYVQNILKGAKEILSCFKSTCGDRSISLTIGISSGSYYCGVIGDFKIFFDVFGMKCKYSCRLMETAKSNSIHVSKDIYNYVLSHNICISRDRFTLATHKKDLKGNNVVTYYFK